MPWKPPPISLEYFGLVLRQEYFSSIRKALDQPNLLFDRAKGERHG